jgi:hypothetical protein
MATRIATTTPYRELSTILEEAPGTYLSSFKHTEFANSPSKHHTPNIVHRRDMSFGSMESPKVITPNMYGHQKFAEPDTFMPSLDRGLIEIKECSSSKGS